MQPHVTTIPSRRRPLSERFWPKVLKTDTCWLWQGATQKFGYGKITSGGDRGQTLIAHRVVWEWTYGPIPNNLRVLHKCDVPQCVNPEHLWLGTQGDNMQDCVHKGRFPRLHGDAHYSSKLSTNSVIEIRQRYRDGLTQRQIAVEYGVSPTTIWQALHNVTWPDVGNPVPPELFGPMRGERNGRVRLADEQVIAIRARYTGYAAGGLTHKQLAIEYGVCEGTIQHILKGHSWRHLLAS